MTTPETTIPKAVGPYSPVVRAGQFLFVSGQIAPTAGDVVAQTKAVLEQLKAILELSQSSMQCVVKATVYLSDMNNFTVMNEVYGSYFSEPYPARATVQVVKLPKDSLIEIDCVATVQ